LWNLLSAVLKWKISL